MSQETRHEIIEGIMEGSYPIDPRKQSTTDARNKRHSARCNDSETNLQSSVCDAQRCFVLQQTHVSNQTI